MNKLKSILDRVISRVTYLIVSLALLGCLGCFVVYMCKSFACKSRWSFSEYSAKYNILHGCMLKTHKGYIPERFVRQID